MKNYYLLPILGCLFWMLPNHLNACGYNFVSSCNTILNVEANGTNTGYYAASCGYLSSFNNKNFGAVTSILLTYGETVTWESCNNKVLNGVLYYRVYETGTTPGNFQVYDLNTLTLLSNGTYRTKKRSNSTTLDLANGLNQGNYTIEVYFEANVDINNDNIADATIARDNNGNYYKAFFNLTNGGTGDLNVNFPNKNNISCGGLSDGDATAASNNGSAPYTYTWSNGQTTATSTNLSAGTYTVTVTDAMSATGTANVAITQPSAITPNASATDTNSSSSMNGTATATPFGGTQPYNYAWSNNQVTKTISSLNSGSYTVTVTDANGCIGMQSVFVSINSGVPITYCTAQSDFPWTDWISNVTFNQLDKSSNKNVYNDYTSDVTDAATSSSYAISVTSSYSWTTYDEYIRVWIDYNRDGVFQEPAEIAFSETLTAPATFGTSGTVTGSITIPSNAELGGTRMRVIMTRNAYASPCGNVDYGEIEDYTINIVQGGPPVCSISAIANTSICDDQGTTTIPADDTYTFDLTVTGTATGSDWSATIDGQAVSGTYGTAQTFGPFLISDGALNLTVTDDTDNACTDAVVITPPTSCSNDVCAISASTTVSACDDNGTDSDAVDDTYTFDLTVTGSATGSGWTATIDGQSVSGTYDVTQTFGPFLISGGDLNFTVTDDLDNACTDAITISAPTSCSNNVCAISATATANSCDDEGTDTDPDDDTFTFDLTVTGTSTGSGWSSTINGQSASGAYDVTQTFGPFLISDGDITFSIVDDTDNGCNDVVTISAPASCSNNVCSISATATASSCDDEGTDTDPDDDTFTFDLTVTGTSTGSGWSSTINGQSASGAYDVTQTFGPFLISDGDITFAIVDDVDNGCNDVVVISAPASCSNANICTISATIANITCDDEGTDTDADDDTFSFDLNVTGTNTGTSWETTINGTVYTGNYNTTETLSGFLISDGDLDFMITDEVEACAHLENVVASAPCSNTTPCDINSSVTSIACDDSGTDADPIDDTFTFTLLVAGTGTGAGWTTTINGTTFTGNYDVAETIGPFLIANGNLSFVVLDADDNGCNSSDFAIAPSPCSNGGGPANYCTSAGDFPWHDWISGVTIENISQTSGKSQYSDFTNLTADLVAGESHTIDLSADFSWFTYDEYWKVWIDYDQNGIFDEPEEIAFSTLTPMPSNGTHDNITAGIINVPASALTGNTRMRVTMSRDNEPVPCGNIDYGEVEDYTVNIAAPTVALIVGQNNLQLQAAMKMETVDLQGVAFADDKTIDQIMIEKSADGETFEPLFEINQTGKQLFKIEDTNPYEGNNFYRAKMLFNNGDIQWSKVQKVNYVPILDYAIFPNPVSDVVGLNLEKFIGKSAKVVVSNQLGQPIFEENIIEIGQPIWNLEVSKWREGSYMLWVEVEGYRAVTKRLMVMRF